MPMLNKSHKTERQSKNWDEAILFFFLQNSIGWVEATQKTNANRSKEERRNE
jgi:hypothetical protein